MTQLNHTIATIQESLKSLHLAIVKRLSYYQNVIIQLETDNKKLQDLNTLLSQKLADYQQNKQTLKDQDTHDKSAHTSLTLNELQSMMKRKI